MNEKQFDHISHLEAYIELVDTIHRQRENMLTEMHAADDQKLRQLSGRILQCDEILAMMGWDKIEARRRRG